MKKALLVFYFLFIIAGFAAAGWVANIIIAFALESAPAAPLYERMGPWSSYAIVATFIVVGVASAMATLLYPKLNGGIWVMSSIAFFFLFFFAVQFVPYR